MCNDIIIRLYKPYDYTEVRKISCDTADRGKPVENFFSDREVFADLLTCYYTDHEPGSLWIAECRGRIVGYLMGCLDSQRYFWVMLLFIIPKVMIKAFRRGLFLKKDTLNMLRAFFKSLCVGGFSRHIALEVYPAHLHINIAEYFRGQGIGRLLVERFFQQLKSFGIKGIHLSVRQDNIGACKFFESLGFIVLNSYPMIMPEKGVLQLNRTVVYMKKI